MEVLQGQKMVDYAANQLYWHNSQITGPDIPMDVKYGVLSRSIMELIQSKLDYISIKGNKTTDNEQDSKRYWKTKDQTQYNDSYDLYFV